MTATTSIPMNRDAVRDDANSAARADRQTRLLRESARIIAAGGDPFYPGYNPREVRGKMWRSAPVGG